MGILQREAVSRAEQMFAVGEAHERVADLLADILQFCLVNDIDFDIELEDARAAFEIEQSIDSDTVEGVVALHQALN